MSIFFQPDICIKELDNKVMACTSGDVEISAELLHELNKKATTFLDWVSKKPNSPESGEAR
ncbi:MAG: hypothetical protein WCI20_08070 [bacterium]